MVSAHPITVPNDHVVLVDANDRPLGTQEKLAAHRAGALHRAYSVFMFNAAGEVLLQRRAAGKYHSGGLWSNSCCSHPRGPLPLSAEASARLHEEMGLQSLLTPVGVVRYAVPVDGGMVEHEFNHLLAGRTDATPVPDPDEVSDWRWANWDALPGELRARPHHYSAWLTEILRAAPACLARYRQVHCTQVHGTGP